MSKYKDKMMFDVWPDIEKRLDTLEQDVKDIKLILQCIEAMLNKKE